MIPWQKLERIPSLLLKQDWDGVITTLLAKVLAKLDDTGLKLDFAGNCSDEVFIILPEFDGHFSVGASTQVTTSILLILAAGTPAQVSFEKGS
jgi:hypothetical protein